MNRSKSLTKILWVLGFLLVLFVSQTLAVGPYYRPANPVMDFVPQGIVKSSCTFTPDNPPTPFVSRGGTLGFQATATNNTDEIQVFKFATKVTLPNVNKYPTSGYLLGHIGVTLNPYESKSKHLSQFIPSYAPLGIYTYYGYVGNYGVGIYDECRFNFKVTE